MNRRTRRVALHAEVMHNQESQKKGAVQQAEHRDLVLPMLISVSHPRWLPCQPACRLPDMSRTMDGMKVNAANLWPLWPDPCRNHKPDTCETEIRTWIMIHPVSPVHAAGHELCLSACSARKQTVAKVPGSNSSKS
jgi:hypothetical protein